MSAGISEDGRATALLVGVSPRDARVVSCGFEREDVAVDILRDVRAVIDCLTTVSEGDGALPGLVALDFTTDADDSMTVLNAIRASPQLQTLPAVALVNDTVAMEEAREQIQRAYEHGINGHVFTPDGVDAYADAVQRMAAFWFGTVSLPPQSLYSDSASPRYD